jgi:hypothetical protein
MTTDSDWTPRFSIEITEEQRERASRLLNIHGVRRAVMSLLLDEVLDLVEEHGHVIIGILINRQAKAREIIPALKEADSLGRSISGDNR